jgi:L-asparaginase
MDLLVISTGGSIDKTYSVLSSSFVVGGPAAVRIMSDAGVTLDFEVRSLMRKDSLDMTEGDRELLAREIERCGCSSVVVTHGTDTMAETGLYLERLEGHTVVLTGAMRPAGFRDTDAEFNLGAAVTAAIVLPHGVYLSMNGRIWKPGEVKKSASRDRFEPGPGKGGT